MFILVSHELYKAAISLGPQRTVRIKAWQWPTRVELGVV